MQSQHRSRHKVDLEGLQALCASNYVAIENLMPQLRGESVDGFVVEALGGQDVAVRILERAPYTTIIDMQQLGNAASPATSPQFQVRIYHDARMAEVVACQGHRHIKPRYDYPNAKMYQRDEKFQLNRFLAEWLGLCLANGRPVHRNALLS